MYVCLSDFQLASLFEKSIKKVMKDRSKKMCGHWVSVNKKAVFTNCILFLTFCSMGTFVRRKKTWRYSARKVMEFGLIMTDMLVYVSCKFEMYIFKIALIISENVRIALCTEYTYILLRSGKCL